MVKRFNPPPGWPAVPADWYPEPGWRPDPAWPPPPPGWQFWVDARSGVERALTWPGFGLRATDVSLVVFFTVAVLAVVVLLGTIGFAEGAG